MLAIHGRTTVGGCWGWIAGSVEIEGYCVYMAIIEARFVVADLWVASEKTRSYRAAARAELRHA